MAQCLGRNRSSPQVVQTETAIGMRQDLKRRRAVMVRDQLRACGIEDERVLAAMGAVQRHLFVDEALQAQAYSPNALPIGYGQTISQPFSVAWMASALHLEIGMKVLEVGTGSGYQAAVLCEMGAEVYSVERIKPLYLAALKRLNRLRYFGVQLKLDDGTMGWPEKSPFDRILVTAGGERVPAPLIRQLAEDGMLVMPLGSERRKQRLIRVRREDGRLYKQELGDARFVELKGNYGW
jgi:protein-L-isoaspartate(D-aspartate) O-methyltransferase